MNMLPIETYQSHVRDGKIRMMHIHPPDDNLHRHVFFELVYVVRGTAVHHLENETMVLHAGDYFIIDTGSAHCYKETDHFEIINCLFLPEYIDRALAECPSLSALLSNQIMHFGVPVDIRAADRVYHDTDGSVRQLIKTMEQEHSAQRSGYMELLRCLLTQVLVLAVRACETAEQARIFHSATTTVIEYLTANYAAPLSLKKLSDMVSYTPQYLSTLFHKDMGMSIQEFLQRLRIEQACRLLTQKALKLSDIARTVGYSDAKHFYRIFRRYKGMSPIEFRNNMQRSN